MWLKMLYFMMEIVMSPTTNELEVRFIALKKQFVILKADVISKKIDFLQIWDKCEREVS